MPLRLAELARRLGARCDRTLPDVEVHALATPTAARSEDVTFTLRGSAGALPGAAVIAARADAAPGRVLVVDDVLIACGRAAAWLPIRRAAAHVAHTDSIAGSASIADGVHLGAGVAIGERSVVEAGVVLGPGVAIGAFCHIGAGTVIEGGAQIGNRVAIGAGSVIGSDGFAFVRDGDCWLRMPNFGSVSIGDDAVLLARVVIHAGIFGDTRIERGCLLDSQVLIGHDSTVGAHTAIAGQTAVAGAASIGRRCVIGGKVGIGEGVAIADGVTVTGMSMVTRSIGAAGARFSSGWPAEPSATWWRRVGRLRRQ